MSRVALLTIGNEVVDGRTINTNASWLSQELKRGGFQPNYVMSCRDDLEAIESLLDYLAPRTDFIITSGGLGPTSDDLTRDAVANFTDSPLVLNPEELEKLKGYYKSRGREFDNDNSIQAHFPEKATPIPNPVGTAPGFSITHKDAYILSLPGVPKELKHIFTHSVLPYLKEHSPEVREAPLVHTLHCFGIPESKAGKTVKELPISEEVTVGYRPHFPELEIRLETHSAKTEIDEAYNLIQEAVGDYIYSEETHASLSKTVHELLIAKKKTISVAESCTGGLLGKLLSEHGGSSEFFLGGAITYSNELKESVLWVKKEDLDKYGAVSAEVALQMSEGAYQRFNSDIALSITGIAGPEGGTTEKPVGLFYVGLTASDFSQAFKFFLPTDRDYVRRFAANSALDTARRYLLELPYLGQI